MNYRIAEIFKDTAMGAAGTEIINIDIADPISQIMIKQRSTGNGDVATAHLAAVLPNIEIVDGSDVLYSLAAYEADAFDFYHRKVVPANINNYLDDVQGIRTYYLNFGRYLYDRVLALDPGKFRNLQLKITYDRDAGGNASDLLELQVVAHIFDERKITPTGFLMHKQIRQYAIGAGTWEPTSMPTDYPWRMLMMSARADDRGPHFQFREIKLSENTDERIPFHFDTMNLIDWIRQNTPLYMEDLYNAVTTGGITAYITPAWEVKYAGTMEEAVAGYVTASYGMGGTLGMTSSVSANALGMVIGSCPHGAVIVPFGDLNDLEDWYDVREIKKLKLHIKGHATRTAGNLQICLQQYRPYAT